MTVQSKTDPLAFNHPYKNNLHILIFARSNCDSTMFSRALNTRFIPSECVMYRRFSSKIS